MIIDNSKITAIIFDFGGVILQLDEHKTYNELSRILKVDKETLHTLVLQTTKFYEFECGNISSQEFIDFIHSVSNVPVSSNEIIDAWNAMLLDLPPKRVDLLLSLKNQYRTFLLSNTNALHETCFVENIRNQGYDICLQDMFETVWYSHILGLRKPNEDIFIEVAKQAQLIPQQTLFLDDRADNIATAHALGFKTQLITKEYGILDFFENR